MSASKDRQWRIMLRPKEGEPLRRITNIIGLNGQGFSVVTLYHKNREGYLFKLPVDPALGREYAVSKADLEGFTVDHRAKLSYHSDGFAQFSSEQPGTIISGRDEVTGEPKELGSMTHPLSDPIWSGGSVGVTVWGLHDFEEAKDSDRGVIFEPDEFIYRRCSPTDDTGYNLQIYAFPQRIVPPIRYKGGQPVMNVAIEPLNGQLLSVVELKVIYLPEELVYLGLYVSRYKVAVNSASGWLLSGPGNHTKDKAGHTLMGVYPRSSFGIVDGPSLNRASQATQVSNPTEATGPSLGVEKLDEQRDAYQSDARSEEGTSQKTVVCED